MRIQKLRYSQELFSFPSRNLCGEGDARLRHLRSHPGMLLKDHGTVHHYHSWFGSGVWHAGGGQLPPLGCRAGQGAWGHGFFFSPAPGRRADRSANLLVEGCSSAPLLR